MNTLGFTMPGARAARPDEIDSGRAPVNDCGGNPCATCGRSVRVEYNGARRVAGLGGFLKRCPKARAQLEACNRIFNDCGGTEGTGESRPDKSVPEGHKADFPPGPQSPHNGASSSLVEPGDIRGNRFDSGLAPSNVSSGVDGDTQRANSVPLRQPPPLAEPRELSGSQFDSGLLTPNNADKRLVLHRVAEERPNSAVGVASHEARQGTLCQSAPILPHGFAAPEVADRNSNPSDDFGFLSALPLAIGLGLLGYGCVAAAWIALK